MFAIVMKNNSKICHNSQDYSLTTPVIRSCHTTLSARDAGLVTQRIENVGGNVTRPNNGFSRDCHNGCVGTCRG